MMRFAALIGIGLIAAAQMPARAAADAVEGAGRSEAIAARGYTLGPGDKVKITVFNVEQITGEYSISPAGNVALPLIGDVEAAGRTTDALTSAIRTSLADGYVNDPRVTIEIVEYRPYYILGEVNKPGKFAFMADLTVEQAVASAGGFTYRAAKRKAFLRRVGQPEREVKLRGESVLVMPGDTIRIGERYF